jgi:uncharacterized protein YjiS (DUF1127 family)
MSAFAESARSSAVFAALVAGLRAPVRVLTSIAAVLKNRREVAQLLEAEPGMLRDLGLTPMDINCALAEPLWRDPSARLLVWTIERRAASRAAARENLNGLARADARAAGEHPLFI